MECFENMLDKFVEQYGAWARLAICIVVTLVVIIWIVVALMCVIWFFVILFRAVTISGAELFWLIPWVVIVAALIGSAIFVLGDDIF